MMRTKSKNNRNIFITIFVLFTVYTSSQIMLWIFDGKKDLIEMNKKVETVEKDLKELENKKAEIKNNIVRINEDSEIEKIARDKLNLVKDGEVVYKIAK